MRLSTDTFSSRKPSCTPIGLVDAISCSHVTRTTLAPALAASFRSASTGLQVRLRLPPPLSRRRRRWLIVVVDVVDWTQLQVGVLKKRASRQLHAVSNAPNKGRSCAKETNWDTASRRGRQEVVGAETIFERVGVIGVG